MATYTSNVTSGFIDLATFDEIEKYMYGGADATAYFVRETRKATWFTQVPVNLSKAVGNPGFGQEWGAQISRAGDYLLYNWLRLQTPTVTLAVTGINSYVAPGTTVAATYDYYIRWTRNLMHNIVKECSITFNDLVAARFDSYHLDFWAAFTVPAGKQVGYNNMIGNIDTLIYPSYSLPSVNLNLPLPFFYARDSGVALPTAALPYNEMRINFSFRNLSELLILDIVNSATGVSVQSVPATSVSNALGPNLPQLNAGQCNVWANYAIVSNDERKRMACAPRDILMEQVQTAPKQNFYVGNNNGYGYNASTQYDIRFSHAIKVLFFASRNTTNPAEWSNYTTNSPTIVNAPGLATFGPFGSGSGAFINFEPSGTSDPIWTVSLIYENTQRLSCLGADYYSLVNPFYHAPNIPVTTGYHCYSYSLDFINLDPMGSTNYGKLTNVSIVPTWSAQAAITAAGGGGAGSGYTVPQQFEWIVTAVNDNIIRVSGGKHNVPSTVSCFQRCDISLEGNQCKISPQIILCI